jgi:glycosyltransferase involved in cell wall biosynthesis
MTTVSVVIPAYNEGPILAANLVSVADYLSIYGSRYAFQYVIVDDGSSDDTYNIARTFSRYRPNVAVIKPERNLGLGRALRTAIDCLDSEYTIVFDADFSYSAATGMELLEALERENADVATASPYMRGGTVANVPWMRRMLSRQANRVLSLAANGRYATITCMVRAYRTAFLKHLEVHEDGMESSAELMLEAIRKQGRIIEIPARLEWSEERRAGRQQIRIAKVARATWTTLRLAFGHRPALWLAVPGLFPGLLPLVVAILLLLHVSAQTLAIGTAITVVIQYTSLAIFAGQLGTFFARVFTHSRKTAAQKVYHL